MRKSIRIMTPPWVLKLLLLFPPTQQIRKLVDVDQVEEAVTFYGSLGESKRKGTKRPTLATMTRKFGFLKNANHLYKLSQFEKSRVRCNIHNTMHFISEKLFDQVQQHLEEALILHGDDLRDMALDIVREHDLDIDFIASDSWINSWKRAHRISSRRITKFVSRKKFVDSGALKKNAQKFVEAAKREMVNYRPDQIYNGDQSGFLMEMNSMRTLARTGSKDVPIVVRSEANTKKSYTVLPLIRADGSFAPKLFIVLKEPNGKFPVTKDVFKTHNLVVKAHTTHIMTKKLMLEFFEDVVFDSSMPDNQLLIVDSWPSWKDSKAIDSVRPTSKKIKTLIIPGGCTSMIQPLDVGVFGQYKKIMKKFNSYAARKHKDFNIAGRDNLLKVNSLVYWLLCHPELKEWALYAWYGCGYSSVHPCPYSTPYEKIFPDHGTTGCQKKRCKKSAFIFCLYCRKRICFTHFVEAYHKCN
ncbi:hypothetical protein CAEBREN_14033 [Caenorhabditis brenneri]|uniref:HTH CENPB-type domain-containing protein n=1 Tax=Caenorhabditis brenneri TaxID=135651 RepID=G0NIV9_CAEBE|nr:hypothetical protein CAEBREN_14033 [Caenorhabditis brenneri]